jgi:integrase
MASISKVPTGWLARWRTPDGASRCKTFERKVDAQRHLTSIENSKLTGAYVDPSAGRVTFKSYAEQWRAGQVWRPSTSTHVEMYLRLHVYPRLGDRPLGAIRRSEVQSLVKGLSEVLAPRTVALIYRWTASVFLAAVADRVIAISPCQGISLPNVAQPRVVPLRTETVIALAEAVPARYRALIVLGAGTGPRISEALGVTNDRVDWMRRTVTIDRQLTGASDGQPVFGPVKDKKNRPRTIPLPDVVLAELVEHVRVFGLGPEGLIFTTGVGTPLLRNRFGAIWQPAARSVGIRSGDGYHQLRHYYASLLIGAGESVKVVQDRLGHSSAMMTLDTYSHLWPDSEDRTRSAVDGVLGAAVSPACHDAAAEG